MRLLLPVFVVITLHGCMSFSEHQAKQLLAKVSEQDIKDGRNPRLKIGMSLDLTESYLDEIGFQIEKRSQTGSSFSCRGMAKHFVKVFPAPGPFRDFHHEVHVLVFHDGQRLKDWKCELICTSVD